MSLTLGAWFVTPLAILFVAVCLFLILVILIQKPSGGGLSGAFGGAGGSAQAAFGAKTGDVLTWFTVLCFAGFLILAMGLTWATRREANASIEEEPPVTISTDTDVDDLILETADPPTPTPDPVPAAGSPSEGSP